MRKSFFIVLVGLLSLSSVVQAQKSASHDVKLSVPNILRLKIDDSAARDQAEVAIQIRVADGAFEIAPALSRVQVMANSAWQLSASYVPASQKDAQAQLMWRTEAAGSWERFTAYPQLVEQGENTKGWQSFDFRYGLQTLPADGHYQGTVTYTVTRP